MLAGPAAQFVLDTLHQAGWEAYLVGGCVRDMLMGLEPHDWDITTNALPQQVISVFSSCRVIETGVRHGTVTVMIDHEPIEVTTYRTDGEYSDGRHPDSVSFTPNLQEDLARRDFTMNAIAYSPQTGIVDPFGGKEDIISKTIRCVGDPRRRFKEDRRYRRKPLLSHYQPALLRLN